MPQMPNDIFERFARLGWKGRGAILAALGVVVALGQAPLDWWFASLIGLAAAFVLMRAAPDLRTALWHGWALGVGYFGFSLRWIISPFLVDVARDGWMAPFAVVLMAAGFALFWMLAAGITRKLFKGGMLGLALSLVAVEVLRSLILTGFPWALLGHVLISTDTLRAAAAGGPHLLTLIVAMLSVSLALIGIGRIKLGAVSLALLVLTCAILSTTNITSTMVSRPLNTDPVVRLIQPNAPQDEKWDIDKRQIFFDRMLEFTGSGDIPDLIVWPESAIPVLLNYADPELELVSEAARGAPLIVGVNRAQDGLYFNSFVLMGRGGAIDAFYDKQHLVPFGEYVPGGNLLHNLGIQGFGSAYGGGFTAGTGARTMDIAGIGAIRPLICYEGIFGEEVGGTDERPRALVLITNDAWFGKAAGPYQHLAQARLRAVEQGLPMVRVANTGVSAMIDPFGRITASIDLNTAGFVDAVLPEALPPTPYSKYGDIPVFVFLIILMSGLYWRKRQF